MYYNIIDYEDIINYVINFFINIYIFTYDNKFNN